jgi:predicted choloylglycine hydrolase
MMKTLRLKTLKWSALWVLACAFCFNGTVLAKGLEFSEKIILQKQPDTFSLVRHMTLRGTQREIGKKLAEIAKERYGVQLRENPSDTYGKARYAYLEKNYPQLLERSRGVLEAFGQKPDDPKFDPTSLMYSMGDFGCSMLYFPAAYMDSGHCVSIRNMDFTAGSISQLLGKPRQKGEADIFGEFYVVESYPDSGYATLYMGAVDLLSGVWDGMNEHGLTIYGLVDMGRPRTLTKPSGNRVIGLNPTQVMRMVLETCRDCEEAKQALLTNHVYDFVAGIHYLIGDAKGNSFIFEIDQNSGEYHIQEGNHAPQVMTNSPVWALPPLSEFPKTYPAPYDSMNRYQILTHAMQGHTGKFTELFMIKEAEDVFPRMPLGDPNGPSMTYRPLWQVIYDMTDLKMKVRFWLKDGSGKEKIGPSIVMSDWYAFSLASK